MDDPQFVPLGYLAASTVIDSLHPEVIDRARGLAKEAANTLEVARRCYTFVQEEIAHSFDIGAEPVTCSASEVLHAGHGICYAQSHLLAALLRANGIPAGFGYQRLRDDQGGFCLHGYNHVYLPVFGWYRIDARGNTGEIDARFSPPQEQLAFTTNAPGEFDYGLNLAEPLTSVVRALQDAESVAVLRCGLPSSVCMG
jgi:transglutaminase-like putative cysteine protease